MNQMYMAQNIDMQDPDTKLAAEMQAKEIAEARHAQQVQQQRGIEQTIARQQLRAGAQEGAGIRARPLQNDNAMSPEDFERSHEVNQERKKKKKSQNES